MDPKTVRRERIWQLILMVLAVVGARYGISIPPPQLPPVQLVPVSIEELNDKHKQQEKHKQEVRGPLALMPKVDIPPYCLQMKYGNHLCSATCIGSVGEVSLCITASHCFEHTSGVTCYLASVGGKEWYTGSVVGVSESSDVACVVVSRALPACDIDDTPLKAGDTVEHYGITSGHTKGKVTYVNESQRRGSHSLRTNLSSIPGDSGAGILRNGKYVGTNWGRWLDSGEQGGTTVRYLSQASVLWPRPAALHPDLWAKLPRSAPLPPVPDLVLPPTCPPGGCPQPERRVGPIRRWLRR